MQQAHINNYKRLSLQFVLYFKPVIKMTLIHFLLVCNFLQSCFGQTVINVATGIYSTKRESTGLSLPATSGTFQPVGALTTKIHLTIPYTVFVHYQITIDSVNTDFLSKLQVNHFNAGSLIRSGIQRYKTATGFWTANLNPGYYTFEVHYKSPVSISVPANWDWQTAVLQVMWFEDAFAVSEGIKCYPTPTMLNAYNNLGPIENLETTLLLPSRRIVMAGYQLSLESSKRFFVTKLNINDQYEESTTVTEGYNYYLSQYSLLAKSLGLGLHYFGVTYRTDFLNNFTDCTNSYTGNTNVFAIYLPSTCSLVRVHPQNSLLLPTSWQNTDLTYKLLLSQPHHVFIRYQFSKEGRNSYIIARLSINNSIQPHTMSIRGNSAYAGLFGFWQGSLSAGTHQITVQHRGGISDTHYANRDYSTRAMDIIYCY